MIKYVIENMEKVRKFDLKYETQLIMSSSPETQ